ncbi:hypothetical protein [Mangrovimonas spongiae]|uniref:Host attachment protein n=1 Tax=Mangrovimonas spongiae TaxID=2494697 RepID=A0A3R9MH70_9FLAO|nr:hypothetical protein [Mangrovimonas spongiae]RSK40421.1 hypothetical protein EJA19_05425 [Mangrovimonas spongiae]
MKNVGIWLDKEKALIVTVKGDKETLQSVPSNIENFHVHGGSGSRFKGGPQDVVQDSKYLEREKHQLKQYFKTIVNHVNSADALVVFGPAETKDKFIKEVQQNYKPLTAKIKEVKKTDSMTDNQLKALVRDYFMSN